MPRSLVRSPVATDRLEAARAWLDRRAAGQTVVVVGATLDACNALVRDVVSERGSAFGWHRFSLGSLAGVLALPKLAEQGLVPVGSLAHEALVARTLDDLARARALGRLAVVADKPRLPRAVAATLHDLRLAGVPVDELAGIDATLARILEATERARDDGRLADRATTFRLAAEVARATAPSEPIVGAPLLLLDVPLRNAVEGALVEALAARSSDVLATVPEGDDGSRDALERALGVAARPCDEPERERTVPALRRLARHLFARGEVPRAQAGAEVTLLSAPGERRECTEIARLLLKEAAAGARFDRMAVLLRRPAQYRGHLEHALRRADIPAHFARGTVRPDPAGRALLALLGCAAEGLSARRFAEYLSLGELPDADADGAPARAAAQWVPSDDELSIAVGAGSPPDSIDPSALDRPGALEPLPSDPDREPVVAGSLRAPRRWEQLLVDAAVIGGRDRWARRLDGLRCALERALATRDDPAGAEAERDRRRLAELGALRDFALPLLAELEGLAEPAAWGEWLERLERLSTRAIRHPDRILACLAELRPMGPVGPVGLREVRIVLTPRLSELVVRPGPEPAGHVLVLPIEAARGRSFDVVFVPGLAERMFPPKLTEDPILRDRDRRRLSGRLAVDRDRVADERLALRLAVGSARRRVVLSYPRLDLEQARPRVPSFYGLEVVRAAEGELPGFDELARRAAQEARTRIGWPAPESPADAIDEAEHDLALLDGIFRLPEASTLGAARYLLGSNPHLARALRARARRWRRRWGPNDGLVEPGPAARAALAEHALERRSYSPTALERYARCPYAFYLHAVHRLAPREVPEAIEEMSPLVRGSLTHDVQFELLGELRSRGWLPLGVERVEPALSRLDDVLERVAERYRDELAPAIERVWHDGVDEIRADLREWLRRALEEVRWIPAHFELSFGLAAGARGARDERSRDEPVELPVGLRLRGSIDLVERSLDGQALRATDHKTGKARVPAGAMVFGGESLQPLLYALALEQMFPGTRVESGRLYYCTVRGGYEERVILLDEVAREATAAVVATVRAAVDRAFLPAAPAVDACAWCDFGRVCGPHEEQRVARKPQRELVPLARLREMP